MIGERIDSVWDLLVARIAALEARVEALEGELMKAHESPDDPGIWTGGNDGPDE